ncbi:MAG: hypothetical protein KDC12_09545 [Flavobacteriales bacterium]|nr:hypothetical protein [Flavobacteriales bacterium]
MRKLVLIGIITLAGLWVSAQDALQRDVRTEDERILVHLWSKDKAIRTLPDCEYTWFYAGQLKTTQGGYDGVLLHGDFRRFDKEGNLIENGKFLKGLKSGEWKTWNADGTLVRIDNYKNGTLHGLVSQYEAGRLRQQEYYKQGVLHGERIVINSDGTRKTQYYKEGVVYEKVSVWSRVKSLFKRTKSEPKEFEEVEQESQGEPIEN